MLLLLSLEIPAITQELKIIWRKQRIIITISILIALPDEFSFSQLVSHLVLRDYIHLQIKKIIITILRMRPNFPDII